MTGCPPEPRGPWGGGAGVDTEGCSHMRGGPQPPAHLSLVSPLCGGTVTPVCHSGLVTPPAERPSLTSAPSAALPDLGPHPGTPTALLSAHVRLPVAPIPAARGTKATTIPLAWKGWGWRSGRVSPPQSGLRSELEQRDRPPPAPCPEGRLGLPLRIRLVWMRTPAACGASCRLAPEGQGRQAQPGSGGQGGAPLPEPALLDTCRKDTPLPHGCTSARMQRHKRVHCPGQG